MAAEVARLARHALLILLAFGLFLWLLAQDAVASAFLDRFLAALGPLLTFCLG